MIWGSVAVVVLSIALGMWIAPTFIDEGLGTIVIGVVMIGAISVLSVRNSTAPARALERRTPVGDELSKEEWQTKHFSSTSWPLLSLIFLVSIAACIRILTSSEFHEWSDYLWAFGSGMFSILGARALWLKYRLSRDFN